MSAPTSTATMGVGIVGPGWIAEHHLGGINGSGVARLTAIAGGREERLRARADEWQVPAEPSLASLVNREDVDAVWLLSPTTVHREQLEFLIDRNMPVLVEKPVALTLTDVIAVRDRAAASGAVVVPGHNQVYQGQIEAARDVIRSGALGSVVGANMTAVGKPPAELMEGWRKTVTNPGGGAFADSGYHLAYLSTYLFGRPATVFGRQTLVTWALQSEDTATAVLEYNGFGLTLFLTWAADAKASFPQLAVWGTNGTLLLQDNALTVDGASVPFDPTDQFVQMVRTFERVRTGEDEPRQSLDDAVDAQAICDAFYRSCLNDEATALAGAAA